jgi:hypothetical protein
VLQSLHETGFNDRLQDHMGRLDNVFSLDEYYELIWTVCFEPGMTSDQTIVTNSTDSTGLEAK